MKNNVSKKKRSIPPMVWIGYLLVVTLVVTGVTFSGYVSRTSGGDTARVAKFQVTENFNVTQPIIFEKMYPGSEKNWDFVIQNESEVALKCSITLSSTGNLPLSFSVVNGDEVIPLPEDTETVFVSLAPLKSAGTKDKPFSIKAAWPKGEAVWDAAAAETYMHEADAVTVTVKTVQVD